MDTKALRQKILDLAIHGKLVPQDPNDEPASVLLQRIREENERLIKEGKMKKGKKAVKAVEAGHCEDVPFEVPEAWEWTTVGNIGEVVTGNTPSKDVTDYYGGNIPFFKPTDLEQGIHTVTSKDHLTELGYEQSRKLPAKSVLVTCIGATIGKTGLIETDGTCNQQINAIVPSDAILSIFLYYLCISNYLQQEIKDNASATTLPILNKNNFAAITIPLPPLAEQRRIVKEIERWFSLIDIIENGKESLKSAVKQAKAKILDLAIHGKLVPQDPADEPASDLLRRINPKAEISSDNAQYENVPFEVPESWEWTTVGKICTFLSRGKSPKYKDEDRTYPVFAQKCNLKDGGISLEQARFLDPITVRNWSEDYKLRNGDVLINSTGTGTVGRTRLFSDSCLGHYPFVVPDSHVSVVRTHSEVDSAFVYSYMSSNLAQQYFEDNLAGSTNQKELYIGVLDDMKFPLPPLAEQHRIVAKIEELFAQLDLIEAEL